ncbi:hypothetical protein [Haloferula sp. BvORR071]|uniref:hypothetical protein n=1 Tax=Haloferula sp. BvORR071 TaxID=1396141 RepID=UPI0005592EEE|nr:hypothetical protein [Haloferula sp. BvORR071]
MKTPWIAAAGALLAIALAAFFLTRPDAPAQASKPGTSSSGKGKPGAASAQSPDGRRLRKQAKETSEADKKAAADLELLWAHGDQKETLDALDKIGDYKDPDPWRAVAGVLIEKARTESRQEIVDYLLATGDAAPMDIRMEMYAAALDNKTKGVDDSARLELQNLTGEVFKTSDEARSWIKSHPPEPEEEPAE